MITMYVLLLATSCVIVSCVNACVCVRVYVVSEYCASCECLCVHCVLQTTRFFCTRHLVFADGTLLCTQCTVSYISVRS